MLSEVYITSMNYKKNQCVAYVSITLSNNDVVHETKNGEMRHYLNQQEKEDEMVGFGERVRNKQKIK